MFFKVHEITFQLLLLITLAALCVRAENFNLRVHENERNNENRHAHKQNQLARVSLTRSENVAIPRSRNDAANSIHHVNFATEVYESNPSENVSPLNRGNLVRPVYASHRIVPDRPRDTVRHREFEATTIDQAETTEATTDEYAQSPDSLDNRFGILETPQKCHDNQVLVGQRCRKLA